MKAVLLLEAAAAVAHAVPDLPSSALSASCQKMNVPHSIALDRKKILEGCPRNATGVTRSMGFSDT